MSVIIVSYLFHGTVVSATVQEFQGSVPRDLLSDRTAERISSVRNLTRAKSLERKPFSLKQGLVVSACDGRSKYLLQNTHSKYNSYYHCLYSFNQWRPIVNSIRSMIGRFKDWDFVLDPDYVIREIDNWTPCFFFFKIWPWLMVLSNTVNL